MVQIGSLSDFELLIHVFHVLRCWSGSVSIATRQSIDLLSMERRLSCLLSASGLQPSRDTMLVTLLIGM